MVIKKANKCLSNCNIQHSPRSLKMSSSLSMRTKFYQVRKKLVECVGHKGNWNVKSCSRVNHKNKSWKKSKKGVRNKNFIANSLEVNESYEMTIKERVKQWL
mmetsp:Transcript_24314/g.35622  ORF Transcript_24314/g.35622 Transcript_24314/m.35622 type:complete len:102 (+) Transcript_24314:480-785(+)